MLEQVDWVQILTNMAKTVGVVLVAVGVGALVVTLRGAYSGEVERLFRGNVNALFPNAP